MDVSTPERPEAATPPRILPQPLSSPLLPAHPLAYAGKETFLPTKRAHQPPLLLPQPPPLPLTTAGTKVTLTAQMPALEGTTVVHRRLPGRFFFCGSLPSSCWEQYLARALRAYNSTGNVVRDSLYPAHLITRDERPRLVVFVPYACLRAWIFGEGLIEQRV